MSKTPPQNPPHLRILPPPSKSVPVSPELVANAIKCIDVAASRGAFKGEELSTVGSVRDALVGSIQHLLKKPEQAEQPQTDSPSDNDEHPVV
jgi:hypothetical protein